MSGISLVFLLISLSIGVLYFHVINFTAFVAKDHEYAISYSQQCGTSVYLLNEAEAKANIALSYFYLPSSCQLFIHHKIVTAW